MLKSVWLTNLITSSLNDPSSVLSTYYNHLKKLLRNKDALMVLYEPDKVDSTYILVSENKTCIVPISNYKINEEVLSNVIKNREILLNDGLYYAPLYFENVDTFGALIFKSETQLSINEEINKDLVAFSVILYSESLGSIIKSFHKTVISTKNLCVNYNNGKIVNEAVKNMNLEIYEKEFTIISGASGSGKSTLLNVIGGMLSATSGEVYYKENNITKMNDKEKTLYRKNVIGFVFQHYNLINDLTAEENVKIAASLVKDPLSVKEVLEMVGLKGKEKYYPTQMSGGEQQRVCIARALVKRPKVLLCDEPTGALDTENSKMIINILKSISKEQDIPVVVITHNPTLVVFADHCITISNGKVVSDVLQPFALSEQK